MADRNKETLSQTDKIKKAAPSLKQNIAAILVIFLIFVYVIAECYSVLNVKLETQTAVVSTVYDTVDVKALVVRDESVLAGSGSAVTVPSVADGEKVKTGGEIAMQFSSAEDAQKYSEYMDLERELEYYMQLESKAVGQVTDVESLDKDILSDVNGYIRATAKTDTNKISMYSNELNDKFTRRQMLIGEQIDFSSVIKSIEDKMNAVQISSCKPTGYIKTDKSGIFSGYTDGCEEILDYSKITELDADTLSSCINSVESAEPSESLGKLITSFDWYFCAVVDTSDIASLDNGDKAEVTLKDSDDVLKCEIVSGADTSMGQEQAVLILKCSEMNSEIAALRLEDIQIRIKSYAGIKVSPEAVHVNNGEKGVYALVSSVVEWRKADILYTGDNFVILSYDSASKDGIKLYDQIVIKGKDLHDGKVYT